MTATTDQLHTVDGDPVGTRGDEIRGATTLDTAPTAPIRSEPPGPTADPFCESVARFAASALAAPVAYVSIVDAGADRLPGAVDRDSVRPSRLDDIVGIVSRAQQELRIQDGTLVGSLCVADRRERTWTEKDFAQLAQLAELLVPQIEPHLTAEPQTADEVGVAADGVLADDLAVLANSVHSLTELAESSDDPRLQRCAATSRRRLASVLESAKTSVPERAPEVREFDLRHVVGRALREATFVSGRRDVDAALGQDPLPTEGDQFAVERGVTHLVGVLLDHTGSGMVHVDLTAPDGTGVLSVRSADCTISAAETARAVASFDVPGETEVARISLGRDGLVASSARVHATSGQSGTQFVVRWALARG
ncbi:HAMP domain-containing histidine kinase [Rhodococcus sp. HNM0569]|uniref:HAMP domain-containing histidine kinase n=1 Tax=Rhodococcus sp. HNM0569 TaxID=2716340 RepID=UPI00146D0823|nr:HAMP domain-containing histidine kinase [Rhodococcus sp. HNM0569]NLU83810.1 HAMP domain-containing histidine kinase [Rhodococcus sp. HNM0569]